MIKKKNYRKVKRLNYCKSNNPKIIYSNNIVDCEGKLWMNNDVVPNKCKHGEKETARWLCNTFDIDVYIMPEIKEQCHKSHDFILDSSNERWDCKADISGTSINTMKNNMDKKQATSYIFDINKCVDDKGDVISNEFVEKMVEQSYDKKNYLNMIIVKNGESLIGIYKKIRHENTE